MVHISRSKSRVLFKNHDCLITTQIEEKPEKIWKTKNQILNHVKSANWNEQSSPVWSDPDFVNATLSTSLKVTLGYLRSFQKLLKVSLGHFRSFLVLVTTMLELPSFEFLLNSRLLAGGWWKWKDHQKTSLQFWLIFTIHFRPRN